MLLFNHDWDPVSYTHLDAQHLVILINFQYRCDIRSIFYIKIHDDELADFFLQHFRSCIPFQQLTVSDKGSLVFIAVEMCIRDSLHTFSAYPGYT